MRKLLATALLIAALPLAAQSGVAVSIRSGTSNPGTCTPSGRNVFINHTTDKLRVCFSANSWTDIGGTGDVVGPASSTDNAIALFDGATGKLLKDSLATVSAGGGLTLPVAATITFGTGINAISYVNTIGPRWNDDTTGFRVTHNIQSLAANRTATWPDANGTVAYTSSNVATATALAANPADCAAGQFATSIADSGNLTCAIVANLSTIITLTPVAFASLGAPSDGAIAYCSDCIKATPCTGGGFGAFAKRLSGDWDCD